MGHLAQLPMSVVIVATAITFVLYGSSLAIYRLWFHPLRKIPGSRLAAATYFYQAYYMIWKKGKYTYVYNKQHDTYGPILRITPNDVHIKDPEYYDQIYRVGTPFNKSHFLYDDMGVESMFTVSSNKTATKHRSPVNPFFSRANVVQMESVVRNEIGKFLGVLLGHAKTGTPIDLHILLRALAFDVVTEFCFDFSHATVEDEKQARAFQKNVDDVVTNWMRNTYVLGGSVVSQILEYMPRWLSPVETGSGHAIAKWQEMARKQVENVSQLPPEALEAGDGKRTSVFKELLGPRVKAKANYSIDYLSGEAFILTLAGGETAGSALNQAFFGIINNIDVHQKLFAELKTAFPSLSEEITFVKAEKLPYLAAVVKECLRRSDGVSSYLPRIVPEPGTYYKGTFIPAGTRLSMSNWVMHNDPSIFPEPEKFRPERWIETPGLDKYMVAFSRGTRSCIGKNLALSEIYLAIAHTFRKFDFKLIEGSEKDLLFEYIYFSGFHGPNQRHVKVLPIPRTE